MDTLEIYYNKFLGIKPVNENKIIIATSEQRLKPVNKKYYHKIIISNLIRDNERYYCSLSPDMSVYDDVLNILETQKSNFESVYLNLKEYFNRYNLNTRVMYRMVIGKLKHINQSIGYQITYLDKYNKYLVNECNRVVSYCKISDIDFGGANIVVWTHEDYRRKRIAINLVYKVVKFM